MKITCENRKLAQEIMTNIARREKEIETLEAARHKGLGEMVLIIDRGKSYETRVGLLYDQNAPLIDAIVGVLRMEVEQRYKELNSLQ